MNQMMVSTIYAAGSWFTVEGEGYRKSGAIALGRRAPRCRTSRGSRSASCSTATRPSADDGAVVGDPTEAALVVLAAKLGVDAEETRRAYPRLAEVPFDSDYKFMATFHRFTVDGRERVVAARQGRPRRRARALQPFGRADERLAGADRRRRVPSIDAANERMGEKGLRVLAFAARFVEDGELEAMDADPMSLVHDLAFVGMVGIIDPLRAEAEGRRADGARCRHRRAHDHRRPRRHRAGDRRDARARAGRDQRQRAAGAVGRGARRAGSPSCTSSAGSRRRTSSASPG